MNNEIKEILDGLNVVIKQEGSLELNFKECKNILDYITNLQREKELSDSLLLDADEHIDYLQEKYERMKENAKILSNGYNELEQRIDKAIEYIKKNTRTTPFEHYKYLQIDDEEIEELENILNGGDDNE